MKKEITTWRELKKQVNKLKDNQLDIPVEVICDRRRVFKKGDRITFSKGWFFE